MSREYETEQDHKDRQGANALWLIVAIPTLMLLSVQPGHRHHALYQYDEGEYSCNRNWTPLLIVTGKQQLYTLIYI